MRISIFLFFAGVLYLADPSFSHVLADSFTDKYSLPRNPETVLQETLNRAEFKDSLNEPFLTKIRRWIREFFVELISWLFSKIPQPKWIDRDLELFWTALGSFVLGAILVLIIAAAVYAVNSFVKKTTRVRAEESLQVIKEIADTTDFQRIAAKLAQEGNYREALINLFRFLLLCLDESGKLSWSKVKTNKEILVSLNKEPRIQEALAEIIPIFDRIRYGNHECARAEYERCLAMSRNLLNEI